jgi:hypothetical protein
MAGVKTGLLCEDPPDVSRLAMWLLTAPILVVGLFAGHELGYRITLPNAEARAEVLEASGHSYFAYAPALLAALAALVALALGVRVRAALTGRTHAPRSWTFALLSPLSFVLLEVSERLRSGELALDSLLTPEVLVGLALQLPFAIAALLVARALLRVADAVGIALRRCAEPRPLVSVPVLVPTGVVLPRLRVVALAYGERGPPFISG